MCTYTYIFSGPRRLLSLNQKRRRSLAQSRVEVAFARAGRHCKDPSLGARRAWILRYDTIRYSTAQHSTARYGAVRYTFQDGTCHTYLHPTYIHPSIHTSIHPYIRSPIR